MASPTPQPLPESLYRVLGASAPGHFTLTGAVAPARPYLASLLRHRLVRPLLVITADGPAAERFWRDLSFYLPNDGGLLHFPAWEVLPFEPLSPAPELSAARIAALHALLREDLPLVVAPLEAVLQCLLPPAILKGASREVRPGGKLDWDSLYRSLTEWGYERTESVEAVGEFARRGGIVDVYPPSSPEPLRLELFGDEVESIHTFDPATQRNTGAPERATLLPVREILFDTATLRTLERHLIPPEDAGGREDLDALRARARGTPGLEHYAALLARSRRTVLDYFPSPPLVVIDEFTDLEARAEKLEREVHRETAKPALPALTEGDRAYFDFARWRKLLEDLPVLYLDAFGLSPAKVRSFALPSASGRSFVLSARGEGEGESPLQGTVRRLREAQHDHCTLLVARDEERRRKLEELCREHGLGTRSLLPTEVPSLLFDPLPGPPALATGAVSAGFVLSEAKVVIVTEEDLFGEKRGRALPPARRGTGLFGQFHLLKEGDLLVHVDHGIGTYGGLKRMSVGEEETDFLVIFYEGGDRIYVPVHSLETVQRYLAWEGSSPRLDKLGSQVWRTTKRKAKKALLTLARDLVRLYAARQARPGHAFPPDTPWQTEFELAFEYDETEDQLRAAGEIKADMEEPVPMDRLVCGDVGYGKTEVAMRAAFKAVMDSRQVALLAPTTLLTQQHLATFRKRFAPWPVRIEMLSRFVTPARQRELAAEAAAGRIDILIGTHRLLNKDVSFPDLGLLIIDEEQRFGVRHKEALKKMRETVDVLALTATPIPRTLYLSLAGIRELSQITTPPADRVAVQNTVTRWSADLIREAVTREVRRGGQVFFVHNRVQTIDRIAAYLGRLLPGVRIAVAHGQMRERRLEETMSRFREGEFDLLVCTTIIESGLDISNANTMIVNRADIFGLAELYQLRGRIGRSRHRAYAYFIIPEGGGLSPVARRRIEVIRDFSHLGAGFQIAMYDLEIRGAGSVLGYRQSGHIAAIGFELYMKMLRDTIHELQGEPAPPEEGTKIALSLTSYLPEDYVEEIDLRLTFYKRIAGASSASEVEEIARELTERFGSLPDEARHLLWASSLRLEGERLGVKRLEWRGRALEIEFHPRCAVRPEAVMELLAGAPEGSRLASEHHLSWRWSAAGLEERFGEAVTLLRALG